MTIAADKTRLYKAVDKLCVMAGTDTQETVEWLCGPTSGMLKLFENYFLPPKKTKSFGEAYPANPDAKCKCEHWQFCKECHPTAVEAALRGEI